MNVTYSPTLFEASKVLARKPNTLRQKIEDLQEVMLNLPQADVQYLHSFEPKKYIRTMIAPPHTVIVGAEHKTPYRIRIEKGTIAVNIGDEIKTLSAPLEFDAPAGVKRVGTVFDEELVWVDIYDNPDDCTDIAVLEDRLYVVPECGLMSNRIPLQLKEINDDYQLFLTQLNLSQAEMDKIVTIEHDLMEMPEEYATEVKPSKIQGVGLFATKNFTKGETVCPSRLNGKRTPGGRFVNHSPKNNVVPVKVGDDIYVVADRDIYKTEELLLNYRDMMFVNFNIKI
jgi:hypothetical protein